MSKMKAYFEVILVFLIIEFRSDAFIASDSKNTRNLQETKSARKLPTDFSHLINDELQEASNTLDTLYRSTTSLNDMGKSSYSPIEQTLEKNYYHEEEGDTSNSVYVGTTENYFNQGNNEDSYKPLIYADFKNTEAPFDLLKGTTNSPNDAEKPPTMPQLPFGLPNGYSSNSQGSQTPTLIMGGFSILVMPMPGLTPGNMANLFQPGQQLGQASGTNPFLGPMG